MSKKIHALTNTTLSSVFSKSSKLHSSHACFNIKAFPWITIPSGLDPNTDYRASFITGKKTLGKLAVYRNRAKNRIRACVSTIFPEDALKGHDYIVFVKPAAVTTKYPDLQAEVKQAASKIHSLNTKNKIPKKPRTPVA